MERARRIPHGIVAIDHAGCLRRMERLLLAFLSGLWATISGGITTAWTSITAFLSGVWTGISTTAMTIFTSVRDFIVNVFTVIGALIVAPLQAIQNGIDTVFGWILSFITQQMNSTNTVWSTVSGRRSTTSPTRSSR